ncbi:MAG: ABC transporter ATP-binding protein [Anaerovoracaceae bacterium]|jgi:ABC-2 type transport system ATP-binding protein
MSDMLQMENVSKSYEEFTLKDISFSIPKGCIMGLIGENGAGKTTIVKLILNLIQRDAGQIQVFGLDNIEREAEVKKRVGVVLDEVGFSEELNAANVSTIMKNMHRSWSGAVFTDYLKKFNIQQKKKIKDYSKGMKTKLSIAVALSHNPDFLILDEPTSGLDPVIRSEILDLLLGFIQDEEKSVIFSTHITSDLEKIADYITFIHDGELVFSRDKESVQDDYGILKCTMEEFGAIDRDDIIGYRKNRFGCEALIANRQEADIKYKGLAMDPASLEEIMLYYVKAEEGGRA